MSEFKSDYARRFYAHMLVNAVSPGMFRVFFSRYNRLMRKTYNLSALPPERAKFDEMQRILLHMQKIKPLCTPEHTQSGIEWLRSILWTPIGNLRKTAKAAEFEPSDTQVLVGAKEIAWVDVWEFHNPNTNYSLRVPVFEVRDAHRSFRYANCSWQAGGRFEITDHAA